MISASMVKIAALGGIALVWWELTCESIKLGQKIIFSSWPEYCEEDVYESCDDEVDEEELDVRYGDEKKKMKNPLRKICILKK